MKGFSVFQLIFILICCRISSADNSKPFDWPRDVTNHEVERLNQGIETKVFSFLSNMSGNSKRSESFGGSKRSAIGLSSDTVLPMAGAVNWFGTNGKWNNVYRQFKKRNPQFRYDDGTGSVINDGTYHHWVNSFGQTF